MDFYGALYSVSYFEDEDVKREDERFTRKAGRIANELLTLGP